MAKWVMNPSLEVKLSNEFWKNEYTMDAQISQLLKIRYAQYMGIQRKNLFFPTLYPTFMCTLCNKNDIDTWLHVLLAYPQGHIHNFSSNKHNKTVWEI